MHKNSHFEHPIHQRVQENLEHQIYITIFSISTKKALPFYRQRSDDEPLVVLLMEKVALGYSMTMGGNVYLSRNQEHRAQDLNFI